MNIFNNIFTADIIEGFKRHHKHHKHHKHDKKENKIPEKWNQKNASFAVSSFNKLMDNAKKKVTCDSECQRKKRIKYLKDEYLETDNNWKNGKEFTQKAFAKYYTYTYGEEKYREVMKKKLSEEADKQGNGFLSEFNKESDGVIRDIDYVEAVNTNLENLESYLDDLQVENNTLLNKSGITSADIITNDRKTYYENEGINVLDRYFWYLRFIYIVCVISFIVCMVTIENNLTISKKIIIIAGLIVYPYIVLALTEYLIQNADKLKTYIPGNAYRQIEPTKLDSNNDITN